MEKFIDVYEGNNIVNFDDLANSGLYGVIIKASEGVTKKDSLVNYRYGMLNGKMPLGFYHMLCVTSNPSQQAEEFYSMIKDKDYQIRPVVDIEYDNLRSNAESYANEFINRFIDLTGIEPMIYASESYIKECFSNEFIKSHLWWVAKYSNYPPSINGAIVAWQYTEKEDFPFIEGLSDCSYIYDDKLILPNKGSTISKDDINNAPFSVLILQQALNIQGFKDKNGNTLVEDGIAGELTLSACPTLKEGAEGIITQWVQSKLCIPVDGIFGDQTYRRVVWYQEQNNLERDGIVGKETWRKLLNL